MSDGISLLKEIVTRRKLIWDLAKADFKKRFVGSYFGMVWMFVQPLVTVLIYFFIFQLGFKSAPPVPGVPYVLWLVPGIVPWFFYSEALNCITGCLQEYSYLVKKVVFQVEILPVIKLISGSRLFPSDYADYGALFRKDADGNLDSDSLLFLCGLYAGPVLRVSDQCNQCVF